MTLQAPGPAPADMLREARRMVRDPLGYLGDVVERYGPVAAFPLPRAPVLLVNDPAGVRRVLVDNHRGYGKRTIQYDTLALVTGSGLLVSDPPTWLAHRRMVQPAFHRDGLAAVGEHSVRAAARVLAGWERLPDGTVVDVDEAMMHLSLQVVGAALFSTDLSGDAARIVDAVLSALDRVVVRARSPWLPPPAVPTPGNLRLRRALRTIDDAVAGMVAARSADARGQDVLGMLLRARGEEGLDDRAVRDEVVTLLVAGHETVASSLTWTLHLLARHPAAQDRLAEEAAALGADPGTGDLGRLPWTRAVVDEGLRLYPPAWVVSRRALADDVLSGYAVPAGSVVLVSPYTVQRDPAEWPDPQRFDPQRWLDGAPAPRKGTYLPFGAGPRLCIGRDFALVESVLALATLARRFAVEPLAGPPPRVDALVTLRPHGGLPLRLRHRPVAAGGRAGPRP